MSWLQRFLFKSDQVSARISELSGGEQARLLLAKISLLDSDVLIFDEPTNDLDIPTLELLERSFLEFPGAIVLVSHDRYLLDRTCTTMIGFLANGETITCADYTQFEIQWRDQRNQSAIDRPNARAPQAGGNAFKNQKRLAAIERRIATLEKKETDARQKMSDPTVASNAQELITLQSEVSAITEEMAALLMEWEQLERES